MTIRQAVGEGVRRLNRAPRVWWIFYAATTIPALLVAAMLLSLAQNSLEHSAWAAALGRNLDPSWFSELAAQYGGMPMAPFPVMIMGALAIFSVVYVLLLGGTLEALCAGGSFSAGCGTHFWRLARLSIFAAICSIPALILNGLLIKIGNKIWGEGSAAAPLVYWGWFRLVLLMFLLGLVDIAFEYGGIRLVVEDSRKAWRSLMAGFRIVARDPGKTIGLYLVLSMVLLLVVGIAFGVSRVVAQTSGLAVLLLFLFRQAAVLTKIWAWLLYFPAQAAMWESLREVAPEPVTEPAELSVAAPEPPAGSGDVALLP